MAAERNDHTPEVRAAAERSYPTPEVRGGSQEEQPHIQGVVAARVKEGQRGATPHSRSGGVAMRRYPSSKVRSRQLSFAGANMERYPT